MDQKLNWIIRKNDNEALLNGVFCITVETFWNKVVNILDFCIILRSRKQNACKTNGEAQCRNHAEGCIAGQEAGKMISFSATAKWYF